MEQEGMVAPAGVRGTLACLAAACLVLASCSSPVPARPEKVEDKVGGAVTAPLNDLNVVRVPIPPLLEAAQKQPYELPVPQDCDVLRERIAALDEILGPDVDAPHVEGDKDYPGRARNLATDEAIGAVRRTTEGVIPFRGWVRKLTGAERHDREVSAAIAAGIARRAFLKGFREARGCS